MISHIAYNNIYMCTYLCTTMCGSIDYEEFIVIEYAVRK